jgi:hypothetical protein
MKHRKLQWKAVCAGILQKPLKKHRRHAGDIYIKQLYECALLFFADRFGIENLSKVVIQQLYLSTKK